MRLSRTTAALFPLLFALGCTSSGEAPEERTSSPASDDATSGVEGGPEPGSGAGLDPDDAEAWCSAVTPEQLTTLTGHQVTSVKSSELSGERVRCAAVVPGAEVAVLWNAERTDSSLDDLAEEPQWQQRSGSTVTRTELPNGADALLRTAEVPSQASLGTVADGLELDVTVMYAVPAADVPVERPVSQATQVLSAYVG